MIDSCNKCRLSLQRTKIVNGKGNFSSPDYFIIGEAPGREEDIEGKPFVGGAGRILSSLLHSSNIKESQCFISNVCRCRPPNNRTPEPDEIVACFPHLVEEIERVNPKQLIALGETATTLVTGKDLSWRGSIVPSLSIFGERPTLITYHPAFLMRQRSMYAVVSWDLLKLQQTWITYPEAYTLNPSLEDLLSIFEFWKETSVAVDIETAGDKDEDEKGAGLNPFTDAIIGIGFCGEPGTAVHLSGLTLKTFWPQVKEFLETHPKLIFQNNLFDRTFLKVKGISTKVLEWDTQTGMHLINSSLPKKLEFLRSLYTNLPPYKHKYKKKGSVAHLDEKELGWYNCRDTDVTLRVKRAQKEYVNLDLMERIMQCEEVALHMKYEGVIIDQIALASHYALLIPDIQRLEQEFAQKYNISISSPKQLSQYLYKDLGLTPPISAKTATGWSTDEDTIRALLKRCIGEPPERKVLEHILEYREKATITSKYCEGLYKLIQEDGRVHPDWKPTGTDTGRWACKRPNLQNFPELMRDVVIPEEGHLFLAADYDRIEVWIAALLSKDEDMISLMEKGVDIHQIILEEIERFYPLTKHLGPIQARLRAKAVVFGTFYGRSPKDIGAEFGVPEQVAREWQTIVFTKFAKLSKHFGETIPKEYKAKGYIETFFGRKKYAERVTQAMNFPVQSTAADVFQLALSALYEKGFDIRIVVHDQCVCQIKDDQEKEERTNLFIKTMEEACLQLHYRFPVEAKIGKNWKEVS